MTGRTLFLNLRLPVIAAPMFLVSHPRLVLAQCRAGIVGTFPSLNARPASLLDEWLTELNRDLGPSDAPFGVNLIVHRTNPRLEEDIEICARHRVPLIITSVGEPSPVVGRVHAYGGLVFHDVTTVRHARKALEAGVDGLILVAAGAGGHAGLLNPFAFVAEVRAFYDGPLVLSGAISQGRHIRAAQVLGADFAYMGTRFIATEEAEAPPAYKQMLVESAAADLVYTSAFSGVPGNFLRSSITAAGIDPESCGTEKLGPDLASVAKANAWRDIWSAGQGVGVITDAPSVATLVDRLVAEYELF